MRIGDASFSPHWMKTAWIADETLFSQEAATQIVKIVRRDLSCTGKSRLGQAEVSGQYSIVDKSIPVGLRWFMACINDEVSAQQIASATWLVLQSLDPVVLSWVSAQLHLKESLASSTDDKPIPILERWKYCPSPKVLLQILGFLHLYELAELVWLARLPLANDFRVRLEKTHDLVRILGDPSKYSRLGLPHYLSHTPGHRFQDLL
jgi:hypothetical protein